jgi:glycosyltransferase involved in cell wall biosynthesis
VRVEGAYGNNRRVSANEERLRVALLDSIPAWGGGQKWDVQTARALTQRGHFVAVACARDGALAERAEAHGVPTWTAPVGRFGWRLGSSLSLARFLRRQGIDLVIANVGRDLRLGAFACGLAGASLLQRRGLLRPVRQGPWNRWLLDHFVRRVLVNSPALERLMLESAPYLAGRVVRLPNAIELRAPDPVAEADADSDAGPRLRSELRIALDAPLVAAVGRLTPMKGFAHLLDAWPRVREAQRTARLVFFGEGEQERELRERAERLGVADSVCFAGFREDTAALHAAAYGCPVVVSEVASGGYEAAHAEGACRVVATGDADALARALVELLSEPALRERMARSAREWVLAEHTVERATERLEQVLREVRAEARRS